MFKSACFFRISDDFELPPFEVLEEGLQKAAFVPCGATDPESSGWVPPRGAKGVSLAEFVGGQLVLKLSTERRAVPASAVKSAVDERIDKWKKETGNERVPGKLKKEFKEDVLQELLPRAFSKRSNVLLWLDPANRMLVVDAGSLAGADRVVTALVEMLVQLPGGGPDLGLKPIQTQTSPAVSMAHWLSTREAPWRFTVDRDCELKMPDEQKSSVRYSRHTLEIDEVAQHIVAGKVPTSLAMTWNDRVSFVLSDAGQVRKIKLLDVVMEGTDAPGKDEDGFDANVAILTGELSALIPDLLLALGGELGVDEPMDAANAPQVAQAA